MDAKFKLKDSLLMYIYIYYIHVLMKVLEYDS